MCNESVYWVGKFILNNLRGGTVLHLCGQLYPSCLLPVSRAGWLPWQPVRVDGQPGGDVQPILATAG